MLKGMKDGELYYNNWTLITFLSLNAMWLDLWIIRSSKSWGVSYISLWNRLELPSPVLYATTRMHQKIYFCFFSPRKINGRRPCYERSCHLFASFVGVCFLFSLSLPSSFFSGAKSGWNETLHHSAFKRIRFLMLSPFSSNKQQARTV